MDYSRPILADRLAAQYVLGTLRGGARGRFETLLPAHPALRDAVTGWQARLASLASVVAPVEPSPATWRRIEAQLFGAAPQPAAAATAVPWWRRLLLWQGAAVLASALALSLALRVAPPPAPQPPIVVLLLPQPAAEGVAVPARFVAGISRDGQALVLRPIDTRGVPAGRALELWAVPPGEGAAPRSLGLVAADQPTTVLRARLLEGTAAFAISVEPSGGSPSGAPTGPIVSVGSL
jgi:anti-sigma-K factor RskA